MKKSILMVLLLAVISPMVLLAHSTHYGKISVTASGNGTVYVSTSDDANSGSDSYAWNCGGSSGNDSKNVYCHAKADDGYEFDKWSWNGGSSTENPYYATLTATSENSSSPTEMVLTASFVKKALPEFSVTFSAPIGGGYTVNGTQVSSDYSLTQTAALETTLVAAPSAGNRFYGWYTLNGNAKEYFSYSASVAKSFTSSVTVGVDFISESEVVKVATFAEADAAMSSDAKIVEITSGTTLIVPSGSTLTVPAGKKLSVDGKLAVAGAMTTLGVVAGDGKLYKISREIKQGDSITPLNGIGDACGKQYRKTEVVSYSPSVTGNVLCGQIWGVLLNGTSVASMQQESPKALKVVLNTSSVSEVNTISSVVENGDVSGDITASGSYILLQDCTVSGPIIRVSDKYDRLNFQGTIDCAGRKVSATFKQFNSGFNVVCLNGSVNFDPSEYNQGGCAQFYNCSSFNLKRLKGPSCKFDFYDCGTASSPVTVSLNYYVSNYSTSKTPNGTNNGNLYFYSGYYAYDFTSTDTPYCHVYGGSFTSDATGYIPTDLRNDPQNPYAAIYDGSKYYVVQVVKPAEMTVSVGGKEYETLDEALAAATDGAIVSLIAGVDLTGKTVTNTKNITLDLGRSQIVGGKIINNGTMLITDVSTANESIVGCDIENNGTLDFVFGTYNGAITCKAGTLTVHNGEFNGVFSREGGTVDLKGGNFKTDISSLITAGGYKVFTKDSYYCPCEMPNGELEATTLSGLAGYSVTPYVSADFALLRRHAQGESSRTDYTTADWARVAELLTTYHALYSYGLDPTLIFDRPVTKGSLELSVSSGLILQSSDFYISVEKDQPYRALTEFLMHEAPSGQNSAKTYRDIVTQEIGTVAVSVADGSSGMNAGTVCTLQIELWHGDRAPDYSSTGRYVTNTVDVLGETRFTIGAGSNKAMIRPETGAATFYAKLADAVAASNGGTVLLAADSTEAETITLPAAGTYIIDPYGFAYANKTVVVAEGLELESAIETDSAYAASQQKAVVYTVRKRGLSGAGTETDPFLIKSLEDLVLFRDSVNAGETKYNAPGVYVELAADIDMAGVNWVGIGSATADHGFMGNFDGEGFKIQNLTITDPALDSDGYAYAGLFSVTEGTDANNQNIIKNLTIENVTISTTGHIVSAAIAYPYYTIVENVKVCGDINISGGNYTAGALAYTRRCVKASNVSVVGNTGSTITGAQTVGGVISDIQMNGGLTANYSNFEAKNLTITGTKQVGGISGIISLQTLNGANVKNVTLGCGDARVGQVAGSLGGTSTISNIVVENVTGATAVIGGAYDGGAAVQAKLGDSYFTTLDAAINAAKAGDTIKLLANVGTDAALVINKELTVDLNGKTIAATENDKVGDGIFCVVAGGELTINDSLGTGGINGVGDNDYNIAIWANGGKVIINGGNFTNVGATDKTDPNAHFDLIYAKNGGEVIINGGSFECETPEFTLNSHDTYKGTITVKGGTFVGFDPRNNAAETSGTTFMATGKYTFAEDGNYIVVTPESYVLNGVASNRDAVDKIDAALAGAVKITKVDGAYVATAEYSFEIKDVDILNPANSKYELTGGTLRPGRTVAVKYIDLATGAESWDKPASGTVTFKLVID